MALPRASEDWSAATWEGSRRAQVRAALELTVRKRLQALEDLAEVNRHLVRLREKGKLRYPPEV